MAKMTQSSTKRLSFTGKIGKQLRSLDGSAQKIPKVGIWKDGHLVGVHEDSNSIKYDENTPVDIILLWTNMNDKNWIKIMQNIII